MSLFKIAWRSLTQRSLSSGLTALSMALGVALIVAVLVTHSTLQQSFKRTAQGYDLIVGPKGGRLELVLSTVFHLGRTYEPLPWSYYEEFTEPNGQFTADVQYAIPVCLGDNFEGYRVVATNAAMFDKIEWARGQKYEFSSGRNFVDPAPFEAVAGAIVARQLGLEVGDGFKPTHGMSDEHIGHVHEEVFKIVGILEPTGTANDRALFVNMEGFFALEGHAKPLQPGQKPAKEPPHQHEKPDITPVSFNGAATRLIAQDAGSASQHDEHGGHDHGHGHSHHFRPLPKEQREVTSILVSCVDDRLASILQTTINEGRAAQAVSPIYETAVLMEGLIGNIRTMLLVMAGVVVFVACIGVMVAMYNSMASRQREISIMRALGASRGAVMAVVLLEAVFLSLIGCAAGLLLGHGLLALLSPYVANQTGVIVRPFDVNPLHELTLIPAVTVFAALAGFVPALSAYNTDVSKTLAGTP